MMNGLRFLGTTTALAAVTLMANSAAAGDPYPLPTQPAAWVMFSGLQGDASDPVHPSPSSWWNIAEFQFALVKVNGGPGESLTQVTIQRPRSQYQQPFNFPFDKNLGRTVNIQLVKAAVGGTADWFNAELLDVKCNFDEVRTSKDSTVGTEVVQLSFSKMVVSHRTQTAQGFTQWSWVPPQFDVKDNVQLVPPAPPLQSAPGRVLPK
jgi:hypothetical protein